MRHPAKIMVAAAAAFAVVACSPSREEPSDLPPGAGDTPTAVAGEEQPTEEPSEDGVAGGEECAAADFTVEGELDAPPEITVPEDCEPPSELLSSDLEEGDGVEVAEGDTAEVQYLLVGFSDGEKLDASWDREQSFDVENVGQAAVIDGWNQGLVGMQEGGRRLLVVPPELGYGGDPSNELAEETLVFVIDLISVTPADQQ